MIPSVLAYQLRTGVEDFLSTTFPISTPFFHGMLDRLLAEDGGVFKGPFLSIQLPFREGSGGPDFFPEVPLKFKPYLHQEQAFRRLAPPAPKSTIVATGTGSGKTESFLYPILDHCYRHRAEPGVKAVLIYPMNALATDQAGRLAKIIHNNPNLKGSVSAGLYIGQSESDPRMVMGPDNVITNKETMRLKPPDILLTNYKMLDYLLIRRRDHPLWDQNASETLKYLVVDELHTFDGAQGTDLACLVRRLKARLGTPEEFLCGVGTSATLGGDDALEPLREYAEKIFAEPFDRDAVITESRVGAGEYLGRSLISRVELISREKEPEIDPDTYQDYAEYIRAQHRLWFDEEIPAEDFDRPEWRVELGPKLLGHSLFHNILKILDGGVRGYDMILAELARVSPELRQAEPNYKILLLGSLLALISEARVWKQESEEDRREREAAGAPLPTAPFLDVRLQLWLRELARMVAEVADKPRLRFSDDLNEEQMVNHLPVVHCRECGGMGWTGVKRQQDEKVNSDLRDFYIAFFKDDPKVLFLFPDSEDVRARGLEGETGFLCSSCLHLSPYSDPGSCPSCGQEHMIRVFTPHSRVQRNNRMVSLHHCPYCGAHNSLTILGSRAASLTSVLIAQLYSSTYNDDKKLLTFSDNVQDAAHRAGFFAGRTYRFNFRSALQKFVLDQGNGMALVDMPAGFVDYWSRRMDEAQFISTFLAPNMAWLQDYDYLKHFGKLPEGSKLRQQVESRISWEIYSEYGFNARIGRTLEKTHSSVAHPDPGLLDRLLPNLLETLKNEIGPLRHLDQEALKRFLLGLTNHLKDQGAIYHWALDTYLDGWGSTYVITRTAYMPNWGPGSRAPVFLTNRPSGTRFDRIISKGDSHSTWYEAWAEKCFLHVTPMVRAVTEQLYLSTMKSLEEQGVIECRRLPKGQIWGIRPEALKINTDVLPFKCDHCDHQVSVAADERAAWAGSHCLRFHCQGRYREQALRRDYYAKLYASGDIKRIFAAEHTGLLDRDERENLEKKFKSSEKDRSPWDPNLLSCTPTLEMGIDIGDLSSLILCSIPPAQANYLQRIGRAGRRDGNALTLTVANSRPHDLFFFAEPEEMISGRVDPPGVFLNASAVLERQFTAFCFDNWVTADIAVAALPDRLGTVLNNLEPRDDKRFPFNFLTFIENHQTVLFDRFVAMFKKPASLDQESVKHLQVFMEGDDKSEGSLTYKIMEGLFSLRQERESLRKKVRLLRERIRRKEKETARDQNHEQDLRKLKMERTALQNLVKTINDRQTFNFFTDEGLIPNYAFPEAGVTLRSVIFRKKERVQEGQGKYENWIYEYERSAASAIDELAPSNRFYAGGRNVKVDQVDMSINDVETWRLCNDCSHAERVVLGEEKSACPNCGSQLWPDEGRKRQMLRMRQVYATTSDRVSRIADDNDNREPRFFNKQILVDFEDKHITDAYKVNDEALPFGFEFLSRVSFREINFGEKGETGEKVVVAGVTLPRKGFVVCRHCGKVQDDKGEIEHALSCTSRDQENEANFTDCVYLYREFSSEAIRILLPVTTFSGSDQKLHSFIAALQLGLKRKFKGNIDHLQTTVYEEPVPDSTFRKKYLVLYDTVPGGTGYLKQLMRSEKPLLEVFELALEALRSCSCNQSSDKDGCYRCLYAYRNSYDMPQTSRDTAISLLSEIISQRDNLVKTDTLRHVQVNALFDSELEARFIEALRRIRKADIEAKLSKQLVNGKPGYFLKIEDRAYYIEPQAPLGPKDGVNIPSKADFLFKPAREQARQKPIAVFTDGFFYHKNRIAHDLAQRMAIADSGKYHVWSLSWKDVENRFKPKGSYFNDFLKPDNGTGQQKLYGQLSAGYKVEKLKKIYRQDSFDWFIRFLMDPDAGLWRNFAFVHALMQLDQAKYSDSASIKKWTDKLNRELSEDLMDILEDLSPERLYGLLRYSGGQGNDLLRLFVTVEKKALESANAEGLRIVCSLTDGSQQQAADGFEAVWNGYLRLHNLFQFIPNALFITQEGQEKRVYQDIQVGKSFKREEPKLPETADAWTEIRDLTDPEVHDLLDYCIQHDLPTPEAGYELSDESDQVIAQAELAWPKVKMAILADHDLPFRTIFENAGWSVWPVIEIMQDPDILQPYEQGGRL